MCIVCAYINVHTYVRTFHFDHTIPCISVCYIFPVPCSYPAPVLCVCVSRDQSLLPGPQSGGDGLHHDDSASGGTD